MKPVPRALRWLARITISILFLALAAFIIGPTAVIDGVLSIPWQLLALLSLLVPASIFLNSLGIWSLLSKKWQITSKTFTPIFFTAWAWGLLTPSRVGELSLLYYLKKKHVPTGAIMAVILVDKFITVVTMLILGGFGLYLFSQVLTIRVNYLAILFALSLALAASVLFSTIGRKLIKNSIDRFLFGAHRFKGYGNELNELAQKKHLILVNFAITVTRIAVGVLGIYAGFILMGAPLPFLTVFFIHALIFFIALIPITNAGLGLRESSAAFLYSFMGVAPPIALSIYLAQTLIAYAWGAIIFFALPAHRQNAPATRETPEAKEPS